MAVLWPSWLLLTMVIFVLVLLPSRAAAKCRVMGDRIPAAAERSGKYLNELLDGCLQDRIVNEDVGPQRSKTPRPGRWYDSLSTRVVVIALSYVSFIGWEHVEETGKGDLAQWWRFYPEPHGSLSYTARSCDVGSCYRDAIL